jgi:hypothetical protein
MAGKTANSIGQQMLTFADFQPAKPSTRRTRAPAKTTRTKAQRASDDFSVMLTKAVSQNLPFIFAGDWARVAGIPGEVACDSIEIRLIKRSRDPGDSGPVAREYEW